MRAKHVLSGLLVVPMLALVACGTDDDDHNDADVSFAQQMIPHHQQATEMAAMVDDRTSNPDVIALADAIEAAQQPEIDTMTGWLEEWGEDVAGSDDGAMAGHEGHGGGDSGNSMEGMMSDEDLAALEAARDAAFDELFLSQMIEHHEGAVAMAQDQIEDGQFPEAVDLARDVVEAQEAEIATMTELLGS